MTIDTFICDTCKRAIDVPSNPSGVSLFPRCVITKNCRGLLNKVNKQFVAAEQYHNIGTSTDTWIKRPLIYNHRQVSARTRWIIAHNLGTIPILDVFVYNPAYTLLESHSYSVESKNEYQTVIVFDAPQSGEVQCIARQSSTKAVVAKENTLVNYNTIPLSYNSAIVIATKLPAITSLELSINTNVRTTTVLRQNVDSLTDTPWEGVKHITVGNNRYNVFGFTLIGAQDGLKATAAFWVNSINTEKVRQGESYILLANSPFLHPSDRILSNALDVSRMTSINQANMSLIAGNIYCAPSLLTTVYPPMEILNE